MLLVIGGLWRLDEDWRAIGVAVISPSSTSNCRWMFRLAAEPKRWISVTPPPWPTSALTVGWSSKWRVTTRCTTYSIDLTNSGFAASSTRSGMRLA